MEVMLASEIFLCGKVQRRKLVCNDIKVVATPCAGLQGSSMSQIF